MKILIDKNIPYVEHFFADHLDQIEYFSDEDFEIENVKEESVVVVRSTYKTHGKKIPESIKFLCSASTGEDHIDKKELNKMKIPYAFSTGANAIAVAEYVFSTLALMLKERKFDKNFHAAAIIGCGNIGGKVIKTLDTFHFEAYGYDPLNVDCEYSNTLTNESEFIEYSGDQIGDEYGLYEALAGEVLHDIEYTANIKLISLHVPLHDGIDIRNKDLTKQQFQRLLGPYGTYSTYGKVLSPADFTEASHLFPTKNIINKEILEQLSDGAIIINTSRGGVVCEKDFLELDDDLHYIRLISDVFENEPNINKDFLDKNLFATPHIAGHSQYARYQMTKMAYENVADFLGIKNTEKENILENKIVDFDKNTFDQDMKEFGLPVSLMLDTYNPKLDHFECADFKKIRDNYNSRIGYSQVVIKGCEDDSDRIALKMLGFKVQDS
tara:strand:+ start:693 stop:2009 length:1317 start_codon:yes stop_codon:yes gene_type:complete